MPMIPAKASDKAKKPKRKRTVVDNNAISRHHSDLPWQDVTGTVGLPEPSSNASAGNHYDDDDGDNGNDHETNKEESKKRVKKTKVSDTTNGGNTNVKAGRDLEARANEDCAMFFGLEVIDGSQYKIETKNNTKYMVMCGSGGDGDDDKIEKQKKPQHDTKSEEPEQNQDKTSKKKKKQKKKAEHDALLSSSLNKDQQIAQHDTLQDSTDSNKTTTKDTSPPSSSLPPKKKRKRNKKKRTEKNESTDYDIDTADQQIQHQQIEDLQTSWTVATGGVVLNPKLCHSLWKQDFWTPTPIQSATLASALLGRRNVVGAAPTGSGKTLAYMLPILQYLLDNDSKNTNDNTDQDGDQSQPQPQLPLQALVLTPTRELALQVTKECDKLLSADKQDTNNNSTGKNNNKKWVGTIVGGLALQKQHRVLDKIRPPILVATPGRLWELMSSGQHEHLADLSRVKFLVIDEADRMINQGSFPQLSKILDAVHDANPLQNEDEDDEYDDDEMDDDDPDRLLGLPGIPGEHKVEMMSADLLTHLRQQQKGESSNSHDEDGDESENSNDDDHTPEPIEMDDDEFERLQADQESQLVLEEEYQDVNDDLSLPPELPPVQRQTFVYSATLTLLPSDDYAKVKAAANATKKNKKKRAITAAKATVEGAIAEIMDKARAGGKTKVVDLTSSIETRAPSNNKKAAVSLSTSTTNATSETGVSKRLPPGLTLKQIRCTQRHKDSHMYAYLVTTRQGASGPSLVFCNSIACVRRVGATLLSLRLPVRMLHASMPQKARFKALESIRQPKSREIVVATDVAARGLDIPSVATVIHYDVARAVDTFVHRAGRTARGMGEKAIGSSLSLVSPAEEKKHKNICEALGSNRLFETATIDGRLLSSSQERVSLASKIVACDSEESKTKKQNSWFQKAAEDAGLDLDEDLLEDGLVAGNARERQQLQQAKTARSQLRELLATPMQTQRFGKFLSVNSAMTQDKVQPYVVADVPSKKKKKRKKV